MCRTGDGRGRCHLGFFVSPPFSPLPSTQLDAHRIEKGWDDGVWRMLGPLLGAVKGDCSIKWKGGGGEADPPSFALRYCTRHNDP